jgi:hypothetical protein
LNATILGITEGKMKGQYPGYYMKYQSNETYMGKAKDPTDRFVFANSEVAPVVKTLTAGDIVELTFVKNGKFSDLTGITKVGVAPKASDPTKDVGGIGASGAPAKGSSSGGSSGGGSGGSWENRNDEPTQLRIARAVAVKSATDVVVALLHTGGFPKTKVKGELLGEEIKLIAKSLEGYLTLSEDVAELVGEGVKGTDSLDQMPFD